MDKLTLHPAKYPSKQAPFAFRIDVVPVVRDATPACKLVIDPISDKVLHASAPTRIVATPRTGGAPEVTALLF